MGFTGKPWPMAGLGDAVPTPKGVIGWPGADDTGDQPDRIDIDARDALHGIRGLRPWRRQELLIGDSALPHARGVAPADLVTALSIQTRHQAPLGDILRAHALADDDQIADTLARQHRTCRIGSADGQPDPRLIDRLGAARCLAMGVAPWRQLGAATLIATCRPDEFQRNRPALEAAFGQVAMAIVPESHLQRAILTCRRGALTAQAESRVPDPLSCRTWDGRRFSRMVAAAFLILIAALWLAPAVTLTVLFSIVALALAASTALKIFAALSLRGLRRTEGAETAPFERPFTAQVPQDLAGGNGAPTQPRSGLPVISILVPMFHEPDIAPRLVRRLGALSYPRELLDLILVLEEDDHLTRDALAASNLPSWMRILPVPHSNLRTKPRALNYALDFARGSIIGVYDAEDAPEPDQLYRVAHRFAQVPATTACLQGALDYYNPRTNWLSRCFSIEYAVWFRKVLPGLDQLGLVVPLGGTTLFFRRQALEALGGWDAHNVTEDADLGIRLARRGYRTELIDTVTREEANCRTWPWIKQRSRWLKGYAMTYAVHMRHPLQLYRDLGARGFWGVQVVFLGTLIQFFLAPLLWSFWLVLLGIEHPVAQVLPGWVMLNAMALFLSAEAVNLAIAWTALQNDQHSWLRPWALTLPLYFPLAALAAYKAAWEMLTVPFYWDKTTHGLHDAANSTAPTNTGAPAASATTTGSGNAV